MIKSVEMSMKILMFEVLFFRFLSNGRYNLVFDWTASIYRNPTYDQRKDIVEHFISLSHN